MMGKAAKCMGYKSLWEEQNLAVKGMLNGGDDFCSRAHEV